MFPALWCLAENVLSGWRKPLWPFVVNLVLWWPVVSTLALALHKAAHAVAGTVLGLQLRTFSVGAGRGLVQREFGGVFVEWKLVPTAGLTFFTARSPSWLRTRLWLMTFAGPAATTSLMLWAARDATFTLSTINPSLLFALANATYLVGNLLPNEDIRVRTDLAQLFNYPRLTDDAAREFALSGPATDARAAMLAHDHPRVDAITVPLLEANPAAVELRFVRAYSLVERGDFDGARAVHAQLELLTLSDTASNALQTERAWLAFCADDTSRSSAADADTEAALARAPTPHAIGMRGVILMWLGRHDEAVPLLDQVARSASPFGQAQIACCLAMAWAGRNDRQRASEWLSRARTLDPKTALLARAEAAVAAA